ncbi:hypothetical protein TRFO_26122 [Tritrichomonas foetus]|uniref:HECT-type E3 ubiquitin transferase n=1 Tax=Tritrichomonas foetus TaxID=1144522 RepID=A0A1J4K453_9EUKA|nr:hypothetical protein TRFO_26122 [Tritrichomonas foetus]|eukprot:OHT05971.1 hypothetical protein TRFO_26122 [Tritrichomonas foetus]
MANRLIGQDQDDICDLFLENFIKPLQQNSTLCQQHWIIFSLLFDINSNLKNFTRIFQKKDKSEISENDLNFDMETIDFLFNTIIKRIDLFASNKSTNIHNLDDESLSPTGIIVNFLQNFSNTKTPSIGKLEMIRTYFLIFVFPVFYEGEQFDTIFLTFIQSILFFTDDFKEIFENNVKLYPRFIYYMLKVLQFNTAHYIYTMIGLNHQHSCKMHIIALFYQYLYQLTNQISNKVMSNQIVLDSEAFIDYAFSDFLYPDLEYLSIRYNKFSYVQTPSFLSLELKKKLIENDRKYLIDVYKGEKIVFETKDYKILLHELNLFTDSQFKMEHEFSPYYFFVLSKTIFDPNECFFEIVNGFSWFCSKKIEKTIYYSIGVFVGLALVNSQKLPICLPNALLKKLCFIEPNFDDFSQLYPDVALSLSILNDMVINDEDISSIGLTFCINQENSVYIELVENGNCIGVNNDNFHEYLKLYINFYLNDIIFDKLNEFRKGFKKAIQSDVLKFLKWEDIGQIINGDLYIDWQEFENNTQYVGYKSTDIVVQTFWSCFFDLPENYKKKFLIFVNGKIQRHPRIKIFLIDQNGKLPYSQVCFSTFYLPKWIGEDIQKMKLMISYCINYYNNYDSIVS